MENNETNITQFDEMTFSNRLQILKTFFPYMPPSSQKFLSSYIKITELSNAIKLCNDSSNSSLAACSADERKNPIQLLNEIKAYCSKKEQENVDMVLNFYNAFTMYRNFMDMEKSSNNDGNTTFFDSIKNMLTPEQLSMFDNYQSAFNLNEN